MRLFRFKFLLLGIACISINTQAQQSAKTSAAVKFIDPKNMDFTIKPGDDFYLYANGVWIKNNPVPAKETRWGSFHVLKDFNTSVVKSLLTEAASNKSLDGSPEQRIGDFYAAGMDSIAIEKLGFTPILPDLKRIDQIKDLAGIINEAAVMRTKGIASPMFTFYVNQDSKNVNTMISQLYQGGTTLPDRDYYLKDNTRNLKIKEAYQAYIVKLFTLTGSNETIAKKNAEIIFAIEKSLAESQLSRVELRDPVKTYNKFSIADFSKTTPYLNWQLVLAKMKVNGQDSLLVSSPKFFSDLNTLLTKTSIPDWKIYLQWNVLKKSAPYLSSAFVDANFAFNQVLSGQKVQTPRWQRMSNLTDDAIGELLGQLYVRTYFKPEAKARMMEMIGNLRKAFEIRIKNLDWMSDVTKERALAKLAAFSPKIGYPDKWKTYEGLKINRATFFANVRNAEAWEYHDMVNQLGKPVDRTRWGMTPPTVNAYYNPVKNEIVFPAGILQFPFFDPNADDAINYGGIGAVIGHEMSHGFDDRGSQYDKDGTLRNWWTEEDRTKFEAKNKMLGEQFEKYTVLDTLHVNGKLTMGENIGDLGGLNAAYEAFKMTQQAQSNEIIDGFNPDQRFFLSWAQVWRGNILPESAAQQIVVDTHSPGQYRTIGAPVNMDAWYKAFNIQPGDKLYKNQEERLKIW